MCQPKADTTLSQSSDNLDISHSSAVGKAGDTARTVVELGRSRCATKDELLFL